MKYKNFLKYHNISLPEKLWISQHKLKYSIISITTRLTLTIENLMIYFVYSFIPFWDQTNYWMDHISYKISRASYRILKKKIWKILLSKIIDFHNESQETIFYAFTIYVIKFRPRKLWLLQHLCTLRSLKKLVISSLSATKAEVVLSAIYERSCDLEKPEIYIWYIMFSVCWNNGKISQVFGGFKFFGISSTYLHLRNFSYISVISQPAVELGK